jgi:hypothetical protein
MRSAGFQLSVRFRDGSAAGLQAGELSPLDERTALTTEGAQDLQYLHHTPAGTLLPAPDTARWILEWVAPPEGALQDGKGEVVFHLAATAADDDGSPFGDLIYTHARPVPAAAGVGLPRTAADRRKPLLPSAVGAGIIPR